MKQGDPEIDTWWNNGQIIECTSLSNGYLYDRELANKYLILGRLYEVAHSWTWPYSSEVEVTQFPGIKFNTVHFK